MTYTINNNSVNVWIRDYDDTMDLSPETDAGAVYLNNGRTLEQELGEGSMVSNVVTVNSATSKVIDGTYDGAYESLVFKGRSLVNHVKLNSKIASRSAIEIGVLPIDHTKTYLLKVRINEVPTFTNESDGQMALKIQYFSTDSPKGFTSIPNSNMTKGYELIKVVNPVSESNTNGTFSLWIPRYISGTLDVDIVFIPYQEGMEYWDIPYFEGLCDVKMPILRNVGKNLFSFQGKEESRYYRATSGDPVGHSSVDSYCVSVLPNMTYTITITGRNSIAHISYWTKGKHYVGGFPNIDDAKAKTFTTSSQCHYVKFSLHKEGITSCQFEKSSVATPYEPHKSNTLTTPEEIILRSLPNGVRDTYNPLTGEYVKRVEEIVLNGNENYWGCALTKAKTIIFFSMETKGYAKNSNDYNAGGEVNCDKLSWSSVDLGRHWTDDIEGSYIAFDGNICIAIARSKLTSDDVDCFRQYLQSNPITVQYELATPIIKKVDPKGYPFAYGSGHVILESGYKGQSLLPIMDYSTVVNRTGQIKSIGEQSLRQDKQINKLEQMLVGNIVAMNYNNTLLKLNLTMNEVK